MDRYKYLPLLFCVACFDLDALTNGPPPCVESLSGVGTDDFVIKLKVQTRAMDTSTILYQRQTCDARSDFWNVNLTAAGFLMIEVVQAGGRYTSLITDELVNDGVPHALVIQRARMVLSVLTDGASSGVAYTPQQLGQLPPLGIASGNPCEAVGNKPLVGTVSDICLRKQAGAINAWGVE